MTRVLCLNGPNLDLLGRRQPEVYGSATLADLEERVVDWGGRLGMAVTCLQSNDEGELVAAVHDAARYEGLVINPGALTHTSWALHDAVSGVGVPTVEVHLSNIRSRERWRRRSVIAPVAVASIFGRGLEGYRSALRVLANWSAWPTEIHRYGPHPDQVVDLRRGVSERTVVLIHGGFWLDAWGRDTVEAWAVDLARRGVSTINLEYRRLGSGGRALATTRDILDGIRAGAAQLGSPPTAIVGHSAGAHLGAWAVTGGGLEVGLFIGLAGIYDLAAAEGDRTGNGTAARFDPAGGTSPISRVPPRTRMILVHGTADSVVPIDQSRRYHALLQELGGDSDLVEVDEGHFEMLDPAAPGWQVALEHIIAG